MQKHFHTDSNFAKRMFVIAGEKDSLPTDLTDLLPEQDPAGFAIPPDSVEIFVIPEDVFLDIQVLFVPYRRVSYSDSELKRLAVIFQRLLPDAESYHIRWSLSILTYRRF